VTGSINRPVAARAIASLVSAHRPVPASGSENHVSAPPTAGVARRLLNRLRIGAAVALPGGLALAGIGISTWVSFRFGQSFAFTGFLHLIVVVLTAMYGGFWQATLVSVIATSCLNYFFVPPILSFVNSPANWVALGAFEFTALVISRLSQRAHLQAMEATAGRRDMERLYETSRRILLQDTSGEPGALITSLIREIFQLDAVQLFDAESGKTYRSGENLIGVEQQTRHTYLRDEDTFDPQMRSWYCVLRLGTRPVGGLALNGAEMTKLAATALASLSGVALERVRALQRESRAQAARQTEQLRTAVLDALAHEFKTPLTVARTASSGLLAVGGLSELQRELVTVVDQQASKLDHLASRLLTAARLDGADFKPQREPVLFSRLVSTAIQSLAEDTGRARFRVSVPSDEIAISADQELIVTSLVQLVDNATKYSEPGTPIDFNLKVDRKTVVLRVRSKGLVIMPADRERIFERFYRATETHHLPSGTGLGLSIVKKIVEAHGGHVWAEGEMNYGTSFSISLPAALPET
jgi:two-component system sensor histidine kinase KdpD